MGAYPFTYLKLSYEDSMKNVHVIDDWSAIKNLKNFKIIAIDTDNNDIDEWWHTEHEFTIDRLCEEIWSILEDVTCDEDGNIISNWWIFKDGTSNVAIWHWMENAFHDFMAGEVMNAIADKFNDNFDNCFMDYEWVKENVPYNDILSLAEKYPFERDDYSEWDKDLMEIVFPYNETHLWEKAVAYFEKEVGLPIDAFV